MISVPLPAASTRSHSPTAHVAHHFESAQQQFDAGKLGMWLFLVTEVLFFSGLFVAYAVYRANHPEIFLDAHKYLNTTLGALNTLVLLLSSLTMAWAVRCAQIGHQRGLVWLLMATLACSSFFLGVKAVEYSHKWGEGLLWAGAFSGNSGEHSHVGQQIARALSVLSIPAGLVCLASAIGLAIAWRAKHNTQLVLWTSLLLAAVAYFLGAGVGQSVEHFGGHAVNAARESHQLTSAIGDEKLVVAQAAKPLIGVFFSIYFAMTGVHAIHILAGMGVMVWILRRSLHGDFGPQYFGPVDYVGLYWHLVDLVWIYLFPLLYLIR